MESRSRSASESHFEFYLGIESDCESAARYVEFSNIHRNVYSHYFSQILTTAAAEFESVSKAIAAASGQREPENILQIQEVYAPIINCTHRCKIRTRKGDLILTPFSEWAAGDRQLIWWKAYNNIKHSRHINASDGSMVNALSALAALYFSNLVLSNTEYRAGLQFSSYQPTSLFSLMQFPGEPEWWGHSRSSRKLYFLNAKRGEGQVGIDVFESSWISFADHSNISLDLNPDSEE